MLRDNDAEELLVLPATLGSNWLFEDRVLELGTSYCAEGMNAVDYGVDELGADKVAAVHFPGDYGDDTAVGARIAAEARGADFTDITTGPGADQQTAAVAEVLAARRAGVWFDVANGRTGHLRWDTFDRIIQAGFWPDTISTDGSTTSPTAESVIDFPNVLSKFLNFGMTLDQVVARATVNASRIFPLFHDRGTLNVGAPADVAVLELREGTFEFVDNYGNTRTGRQRLFPSETVLGGNRVPRA